MALGIAGTAGSGKTTICQMMFNSEQVKEHFLPRIWVCMTKQPWDDPDPKVALAERMLTCLGEDEEIIEEKKRDEDRVSGLVSLLHRHLVGKRYLIVLDDAWDADGWYNLGFAKKCDLNGQKCEPHMRLTNSISDYSIQDKPNKGKNFTWVHSTDWSRGLASGLPKGYGGAVIVNGRSDTLVEMMVGKENVHHLLPLTDEDCWAIFTKASGDDDLQRDPQVVELRRFVVQGAGGHPLMAKIMGQCYRDMQPQVEDTAQQAADNRNVSTEEESAIGQANSSNGSSIAQVTDQAAALVTTPQPVNSSSGSSITQVTEPELAQVTTLQPVNSSTDSSTAQITGPESAQVTALQPVNSSNGSSTAQVTGPESAQVTAPQTVNNSSDSSIAQITRPESAQVTAQQLVNSSNGSSTDQVTRPESAQVTALGSSIAQVTGLESAQVTASGSSIAQVTVPESAQVTTSQPANTSTGSPMEEFIGPDRAEVIAPQSVDSGDVKKNRPSRTKSLGSLRIKFPFGLRRSKTTGPDGFGLGWLLVFYIYFSFLYCFIA
ncbi:uncharacterized protein LOC130135251 [Syzygium oleosum]|uniref:uncharacterized protein LOC130135251 n=1 Tax=Syzygium oleosum TaxID=219896 RepID=UPI0024BB4D02|nr:uncharacterized protein LOC130135251 [Syzygium oleosum]